MRVRGYPEGTPCWAELIGEEPADATAFYGELFGWKTDDRTFRLRDLAAAGLSDVDSTPGVTGSTWATYVAVEDIEATAVLVADAGGTVLRPAHEMPNGGLGALFTDPDGAVFGAFEKKSTFGGAQINEEPGASCWFELSSPNPETISSFYGKIFHWAEQNMEYTPGVQYSEFVTSSARTVAGMRTTEGAARWLTCFEAEDVATTAGRCVALGGSVVAGMRAATMGAYAILADPSGAEFGVISFLPELHA
ncbi:VOC family protein [Catenuloplanes japonicus]|uniref:VOC family protein n=1 Tax=Catenuloplanes japonicus TaxID=33876 RepID=UPI0005251693|nr:VOC family protein [Catenuloplanes japonicus]